jgi:hypothetical protein
MRIMLPMAFSCILCACATSPVGVNEAKTGHVIANPWLNPAPNTGEFTVTRDSGLMGGACAQKIYVDGYEIASLRSGQKATVYLPAGDHKAGVTAAGICGGGTDGVAFHIKAGAHEVYRVASGQSGDIKIEPSAF